MSELMVVAVLAADVRLTWIDVVVLGIFALAIVAILLVPLTIDMVASHRTYRALSMADPANAPPAEGLQGVQGLARATMAFAVIAVVGFGLAYILVERPFADNKTITSNIVVALTTTLASITAFYFGSRLAAQAHRDATAAVAAGAVAAENAAASGPVTSPSPPSITITTPSDGAVYNQNDIVVADYTCTPSPGAQVASCVGPFPSGSPVDTSQPGTFAFTVQATDSAGQSAQMTHAYTIQ